MKTAFIITGQMRTFATCVHTMRWHLFRHYPDADFYISTTRDADTESWRELKKLYPRARIEVDVVDTQPDITEPFEPVRFEPYERSVPVQSVLRQLWQLERGWTFARTFGVEYGTYIRLRPDSFFHSFATPGPALFDVGYVPWWGRFGGVNDRFAVLGHTAALSYFSTFSRIDGLMAAGCPLHPESLVRGSMEMAGCLVMDTLRAEFSTLKHGQNREPEIGPIDIAHMR